MDKFYKLNLKLLYCYQSMSSKEEADEKCQQYADETRKYFDEGNLEIDRMLKKNWINYYSK